MKLHRIKLAVLVGHSRNGAAVGAGHELEARRQFSHFVTVAHPDVQHTLAFRRGEVSNIFQQRSVAAGAHCGKTEFTGVAGFHFAAQLLRHCLHAIANPQHRQPQIEHSLRGAVSRVFGHTGVAAGQDDALQVAVGGIGANPFVADVARVNFTKHVRFTHPAGD